MRSSSSDRQAASAGSKGSTLRGREGVAIRRIYCFINARGQGGYTNVLVEALCEDGDFLASHRSSDESWARYDIGIDSEHQHAGFEDHCPDGYTLEWVDGPLSHDGRQGRLPKTLPPIQRVGGRTLVSDQVVQCSAVATARSKLILRSPCLPPPA